MESNIFDNDDLIDEIGNPIAISPNKEIEVSQENEEIEFAKENIKTLISTGAGALEELCNLASMAEHPKHYEVISGLLKNLTEMNKSLVDIEEKKRKDIPEKAQVVNNENVYIGTTKDILERMLKEKSDEKEKTDK